MKSVCYKDLQKGEYYSLYKQMSNKKLVMLFQIMDSQPIMETFTIIKVIDAWFIGDILGGEKSKVLVRKNYISELPPDADFIFELEDSEIKSHIVIPQI